MSVLKDIAKDVLGHAPIGMIVLAPIVLWMHLVQNDYDRWAIIVAGFVSWGVSGYCTGWLREDSQHREHFDKTPEGWGWFWKGFPFGGRHRDMLGFALGGAIDCAIVLFVPWFN